MTLDVRLLKDTEFEAWDSFVYTTSNGSICSTSAYLDALCTATGDSYRIAAIERDGRYMAGAALFDHKTRWGTASGPRLLLPYNGLVYSTGESSYPSKNESQEIKLQSALAEFLENENYARLLVKCRSPIRDVRVFMERGWHITPTFTYVAEIADLEQLWSRVDRNLKRLIKRCRGEQFNFTDDDDFDSFYALHRQVHQQKGAPLYLEADQFRNFFSDLHRKGLARLFHARNAEGQAVASQIVLTGNHSLSHTVAAGSDSEYAASGVNAFLRWSAFERLSQEGYKENDLTDASLNSVSRFKSQLGGDLTMSFALGRLPSTAYRLGSRLEHVARQLKSVITNG
jgi:hypothetical protein